MWSFRESNSSDSIFTNTKGFIFFVIIAVPVFFVFFNNTQNETKVNRINGILVNNINYVQNSEIIEKNIVDNGGGRKGYWIKFSNLNKKDFDILFWEKLRIGDSISKRIGNSKFTVYRDDSTFVFDYYNVYLKYKDLP